MTLRWLGAALAVFLVGVTSASAQRPADVDKVLDNMNFLTDGKGHYIAFQPGNKRRMFYSNDGKVFYEQRVRGSSTGQGYETAGFWAPNSEYITGDRRRQQALHGSLRQQGGTWTLTCGKTETKVFEVDAGRRAKLKKSSFRQRKHQRQVLFLGRDDDGVYYLVDQVHEDFGTGDQHFFVGRAGSMKAQPVWDIIHDGVGLLIRTEAGLFSNNRVKQQVSWRAKSGSVTEVFAMDPLDYDYLVHTTLGVYSERLGTPCDDL